MKKLLSCFIALILMVSNLNLTVFAQNASDGSNTTSDTTSSNADLNDSVEYVSPNINLAQLKIGLLNEKDTIHCGEFPENVKPLSFDELDNYDYAIMSFASTKGIQLSNYKNLVVDANNFDSTTLVDFSLNENIVKYDINLDYKEIECEKIFIAADAVSNNKIEATKTVTLSVLPTVYGNFVSNYGKLFAYDKYISYLYENKLISDSELKTAYKKMTEIECVETNIYSSNSIDKDNTIVYFDIKTNSVKNLSYNEYCKERLDNVRCLFDDNTDSALTISASNNSTFYSPSITITRTITALSGGDQLHVFGEVLWSDIDGNIHPARSMEVEIVDQDVQFDDVKATVYTTNSGYYSAVIDNQNDVFENGCDIYIRINAYTEDFEIVPGVASGIFSEGYYKTTEVSENITTTLPEEEYCLSDSNTDEIDYAIRAFNIHQAMIAGYYYYQAMNLTTTSCSVKYPHDEGSEALLNYLKISENNYHNWDTILHELGHWVAVDIGVAALFTDSHYMDENLMERYGKELGVKGSWNEGFASYFSMVSQNYYNNNVSTISNIPNVADNSKTHVYLNDDGTYYTSDTNYLTRRGYGEGNELAVTCVLVGLVERFGMRHQQLWGIITENNCNRFSEFIEAIYETVSKSFYSNVGVLLEEQNIADAPQLTTTHFSRSSPGTFYWTPIDTQDPHSDPGFDSYQYYTDAVITIFDIEYNIVYESPAFSSTSGVYGAPINSYHWSAISDSIPEDKFYWCIATSQSSSPATGPYYSSFKVGYFAD